MTTTHPLTREQRNHLTLALDNIKIALPNLHTRTIVRRLSHKTSRNPDTMVDILNGMASVDRDKITYIAVELVEATVRDLRDQLEAFLR
jgi:hypothetical protein